MNETIMLVRLKDGTVEYHVIDKDDFKQAQAYMRYVHEHEQDWMSTELSVENLIRRKGKC